MNDIPGIEKEQQIGRSHVPQLRGVIRRARVKRERAAVHLEPIAPGSRNEFRDRSGARLTFEVSMPPPPKVLWIDVGFRTAKGTANPHETRIRPPTAPKIARTCDELNCCTQWLHESGTITIQMQRCWK
jgi:hypothetical protein